MIGRDLPTCESQCPACIRLDRHLSKHIFQLQTASMPRRGVCDPSSFVTEQKRYCDHCYLLLELSDKYLFHFTEHGPNKPPTEQNLGNLVANVGCVIDFWELCCVSNLQILLKQVNWRFWDECNSNLCNLPDALTLATAVLCMYKTRIATRINQ